MGGMNKTPNPKVIVSHSFGKDSTLSLHKAVSSGASVQALLVSVNQTDTRSWFHGVSYPMMQAIAKSLHIPLYPVASNGTNYREKFVEALQFWQGQGVTRAVFGDIDIEDHRTWCQQVSEEAGLEAVHPLWGQAREDLVFEFIDLGYKALIKTVSKKHKVPKEFLGRTLDRELVAELQDLNIDPCGEGGEFHTLVVDGPLYKEPVAWKDQGIYESEFGYTLII